MTELLTIVTTTAEVEAELREYTVLRAALDDMIDLATMLDDDDPYYGERRNATERIAAARIVAAGEKGEG